MIPPVNGVHPVDVKTDVRPVAEVRPDPKAQTAPVVKSGEVSEDQVTLKHAGQPDPAR